MGVRARLAVYYLALFGILGVAVPFWPLWLASRGLGPEAIALVLGAGQWIRILTSPAAGAFVDRTGLRRATMVALGAIATLGFFLFGQVEGLALFVLLSAMTNGAFIPLIPLADTLTLARERSHGISYGSIRLWGSVAFIVSAIGCGELLELGPTDVVLWSILVLAFATTVSAFGLPDPPEKSRAESRVPVGALLRHRAFYVFVAAAALAQASHAVYYAFGSIHWEAAGHSSTIVGILWGGGVLAEIGLFIVGRRLTARFAPATLIAVGALAGLARWGITGATTALPWLAFAQLLHALTFGAVHLGAMTFLATRIPSSLATRAQTIYAAVVGGVAMGTAIPLSGPLYRAVGAQAFHYAALLSGAAAILALVLRAMPERPVPGQGADPNPY